MKDCSFVLKLMPRTGVRLVPRCLVKKHNDGQAGRHPEGHERSLEVKRGDLLGICRRGEQLLDLGTQGQAQNGWDETYWW